MVRQASREAPSAPLPDMYTLEDSEYTWLQISTEYVRGGLATKMKAFASHMNGFESHGVQWIV